MARHERSTFEEAIYREVVDRLFDVVPMDDEAFGEDEANICMATITSLEGRGLRYATAAGMVVDAIAEIAHNKVELEAVHTPGDIYHG